MARAVWRTEVKRCVDDLGKREFALSDMVLYVPELKKLFPRNNHVEEKIRQTLQYLRDDGYVKFVDNNGTYRRLK